jgi:hypothetical protein
VFGGGAEIVTEAEADLVASAALVAVTAIISDLRYCSANNSITNVSVASSGASGGRFKPAAARWNTWQLLEQQFDSRHL